MNFGGLQNNSCSTGGIGKNTPCTKSCLAAICIPNTRDLLVVFQDPGSRRCSGHSIGAATLLVTHKLSISRLELLGASVIWYPSAHFFGVFFECYWHQWGGRIISCIARASWSKRKDVCLPLVKGSCPPHPWCSRWL